MTLSALARRTLFAATLLVVGVNVALAGSGTSLEDPQRTHPQAPATSTRPARPVFEDAPGAPVAPAHPVVIAPAVPRTSAPAAPATPDRRGEKRGRTAGTPGVNAHRAPTARAKSALRSGPAIPGMGMLLRMGTTTAREISFNADAARPAHRGPLSGRAPPRGDPDLHLALASLLPSGAPPAAPARRPEPTGARLPNEPTRSATSAPAEAFACLPLGTDAGRAAVPPSPERRERFRACRPKGADARPFVPFGGPCS